MCTAVSFNKKPRLFGRNLDLDRRYAEEAVLMPRNFAYPYASDIKISTKKGGFALFGAATVIGGMPLFYEAVNEYGLFAAGLNFTESACLKDKESGKLNLAPHELIPFVLSSCKDLSEAKRLMQRVNLTHDSVSDEYPAARLHFFFADGGGSLAAEPLSEGLLLTPDPLEVLTNEPPLSFHLKHASMYRALSPSSAPDNLGEASRGAFASDWVSLGLGAFGLPGDLSSPSRFLRAAFTKLYALEKPTEKEAVNQLFHILASVSMAEGTVRTDLGFEKTVYTSVLSSESLTYYYTTYGDPSIKSIRFSERDLTKNTLVRYPMFDTI